MYALSLALFLFTCVSPIFAAVQECNSQAFQSFLPANASVNFIDTIQGPNGTFQDKNDLDFPGEAINLPDLCVVSINITASDSNHFSFGLYLPRKWNNRLMGTGNTGFGGGINWSYMGRLVNYGFTAFSIDTGHSSGPNDADWAYGADQKLIDWGFYSMHESVIMAKFVIESYYGSKIDYSYYMACSGGGRQGLKELQQYPDDFQGYAIGAPPWLLSHLHPWATYLGTVNLPNDTDSHIPEDLLSNLTDKVTAICDPQDGVADGTVSVPWACSFDSSMLLCDNTSDSICLTEAQRPIFDKLVASWNDSNGDLVFPSLMLGADFSGLGGGDTPSAFGTEYVDNFLFNNTNWDPMTITPEVAYQADSLDAGNSNADLFDLSSFKSTGGKVMMYHGLADPLIPPGSTIYYYEQVQKAMSSVDDFFRLFLIPGMHHCSGSDGYPFYIAGGGQKVDDGVYSVPGFVDPQHDIVLAVMAWVENGTVPESLIATKFKENLVANGVLKQVPLCPYPQRAIHQGNGSIDNPDNWQCGTGTSLDYPTITIAKKDSVSISPNPAAPTRTPPSSAASEERIAFGGLLGILMASFTSMLALLCL